jgi:hypothetical protein
MRILPILLIVWCLSVLPGRTQLTVEVVLDQEQYLRDEALVVKVRITNRSGQTLQLGTDNQWLSFSIESLEQTTAGAVARIAEVPVQGEFSLESAQVATRQVNVTPWFDISQAGRYQVAATVRVKEWNDEVSSKPRTFEIVRGSKLWEMEIGVPTPGGAPETRKYMLQQANYRKQLKLYLRLTDAADENVLRVFPMGPLVTFSQTEAQVDKRGYLHVLFQAGARAFLFCVVSPDGDLVLRQSYDYAATRPTFKSNSEGRIYVAGGARRLTVSDIPVPTTASLTGLTNLTGSGTNFTGSVTNPVAKTNTAEVAPDKNNDATSKTRTK